MPLSHKEKLIFIHIPKTAGTSITFEPFFDFVDIHVPHWHETWKFYQKNYPEEWKNYKKFAVIRDPVERFLSQYRMFKREILDGKIEKDAEKDFQFLVDSMDINEWVDFLYEDSNQTWELCHMWLPQTRWVCDENLNLKVDYLIRFDHLLEDLKKFNIIDNLDHKNSTEKFYDCTEIATERTKKRIKEMYKVDYILFKNTKQFYAYT